MVGMAIRPSDGQMFGWVNSDPTGLVAIDKTTGTPTTIGGGDFSINVSALSFHPFTNVLYAMRADEEAMTPFRQVNVNGAYTCAWDNQPTSNLWFKYSNPIGYVGQVLSEAANTVNQLTLDVGLSQWNSVFFDPGLDRPWAPTTLRLRPATRPSATLRPTLVGRLASSLSVPTILVVARPSRSRVWWTNSTTMVISQCRAV
jgi:hypothetical protein